MSSDLIRELDDLSDRLTDERYMRRRAEAERDMALAALRDMMVNLNGDLLAVWRRHDLTLRSIGYAPPKEKT